MLFLTITQISVVRQFNQGQAVCNTQTDGRPGRPGRQLEHKGVFPAYHNFVVVVDDDDDDDDECYCPLGTYFRTNLIIEEGGGGIDRWVFSSVNLAAGIWYVVVPI
jgi:hypothetical protein